MKTKLIARAKAVVRFSEVDSLKIVWHGHYLKYFEDARLAFGEKYDFEYMDIYKKGFVAPLVEIKCNYKSTLTYRDKIIIEITYINCDAMKLLFEYKVMKADTKEVVAEGSSMQVLLDKKGELVLTVPPFIKKWKKKWKLI